MTWENYTFYICDKCKYSQKLRLCGEGYGGQIHEYHSSCFLNLQPFFNNKTYEYECNCYRED